MQRTLISRIDDAPRVERLAATLCGGAAFGAVPAGLVGQLVRLGALVELAPGEALIREGEAAASEIYLLIEGTLAVQSKAGFIARLDRPGAVIGEVAVLLSSVRTADVLAESAAQVLAVPSSILSRAEFTEVAAAVRASMLRDDWMQY